MVLYFGWLGSLVSSSGCIRQLTLCTLGLATHKGISENVNKSRKIVWKYCGAPALLMQGCPAMFIHRALLSHWSGMEMLACDWLEQGAQPGLSTRLSPEWRDGTARGVSWMLLNSIHHTIFSHQHHIIS